MHILFLFFHSIIRFSKFPSQQDIINSNRSDFNNDEIVMEELYDYEIDPLETKSYASDDSYQKVKEGMIKDLRSVIWEK